MKKTNPFPILNLFQNKVSVLARQFWRNRRSKTSQTPEAWTQTTSPLICFTIVIVPNSSFFLLLQFTTFTCHNSSNMIFIVSSLTHCGPDSNKRHSWQRARYNLRLKVKFNLTKINLIFSTGITRISIDMRHTALSWIHSCTRLYNIRCFS